MLRGKNLPSGILLFNSQANKRLANLLCPYNFRFTVSVMLPPRKVSKLISDRNANFDDTTITRLGADFSNSPRRLFVNKKCPKWLISNCDSKPSKVVFSGYANTAALLINISRRGSSFEISLAKWRTEVNDAKSTCFTIISTPLIFDRISMAASWPRSRFLQASITRAFLLASSSAVALPIPVFAPVISTVLPLSETLFLHNPPAQ